jgi:hypothetical protein
MLVNEAFFNWYHHIPLPPKYGGSYWNLLPSLLSLEDTAEIRFLAAAILKSNMTAGAAFSN